MECATHLVSFEDDGGGDDDDIVARVRARSFAIVFVYLRTGPCMLARVALASKCFFHRGSFSIAVQYQYSRVDYESQCSFYWHSMANRKLQSISLFLRYG